MTMMITSEQNPTIKHVVALQKKQKLRYETRTFVVEGKKMVLEANPEWVEHIFVSESVGDEHLLEALKAYKSVVTVKASVFQKMSDTKTPQGVMAIIKMPVVDVETSNGGKPLLMIALETIQDPGNMGTIIRTAEAVGAHGILVSKDCVDVYHPKTLRATMGAIYHMPIFLCPDFKKQLEGLKTKGARLLGTHLKGEKYHFDYDFKQDVCLLIGNEGHGLSPDVLNLMDDGILIPMSGHTESLNAGVAASVVLYEAYRQRHQLD